MQKDLVISWTNLAPAEGLEAHIRQRAAALGRFHPNIIGCRVTIAAASRGRRSAGGIDVRIHLELPGPDLDVFREVRQGHAEHDSLMAVNAAFDALEDRLKATSRKMAAQEVKHHPPVLHGEVVEIEPELGWGYLRADDGREVYFQRESLDPAEWPRLEIGSRLRFREMEGDKGPFAVDLTRQ
ncbi:HPF/RaiA family ribosome-associated protein [Solirhodobacter olei]|uniref:HPF/RaiA family ribosome-associated protein n=1 Tax=Solirhodobacter olei TaxID=2493082 RepID=UPI000FD72E16|nr:HPF/RaiA family ribosome-associated protein [Solirhodobacter olei]